MDMAILNRRIQTFHTEFQSRPNPETGFALMESLIKFIEKAAELISICLMHRAVAEKMWELKKKRCPHDPEYQKSLQTIDEMEENLKLCGLMCLEVVTLCEWMDCPIASGQIKRLTGRRGSFLRAVKRMPKGSPLYVAVNLALSELVEKGRLKYFLDRLADLYMQEFSHIPVSL